MTRIDHFNDHFWMWSWVTFLKTSLKWNLLRYWCRFSYRLECLIGLCPVTQPIVSNHWKGLKASANLGKNHQLATSFRPDSWGMGYWAYQLFSTGIQLMVTLLVKKASTRNLKHIPFHHFLPGIRQPPYRQHKGNNISVLKKVKVYGWTVSVPFADRDIIWMCMLHQSTFSIYTLSHKTAASSN